MDLYQIGSPRKLLPSCREDPPGLDGYLSGMYQSGLRWCVASGMAESCPGIAATVTYPYSPRGTTLLITRFDSVNGMSPALFLLCLTRSPSTQKLVHVSNPAFPFPVGSSSALLLSFLCKSPLQLYYLTTNKCRLPWPRRFTQIPPLPSTHPNLSTCPTLTSPSPGPHTVSPPLLPTSPSPRTVSDHHSIHRARSTALSTTRPSTLHSC